MPAVKPTHRLKALSKVTDQRGELGAGWLNPDGSIRIQINPCIVITDDKNYVITLFPVGNQQPNVP